MSTLEWLSIAAYFAFTVGVGHAVTRLFRFDSNRLVHNWAAYYLCGQVVLTTATVVTGFVSIAIPQLRMLCAVPLLAYWTQKLLRKRLSPRLPAAAFTAIGFVGLTCLAFPDALVQTLRTPLSAWDARSIWFFHGKSLSIQQYVDPAFFTNPLYLWSHQDYPLLIPTQAAWASLFVGRWNDYASKAFLLLNLTAYLFLVFQILRTRGHGRWVAFMLAVLLLSIRSSWYLNGYADAHYILALIAAMLLLAMPGGSHRRPLVVLLLAYAASVKNEGTLYALLFLAVFAPAILMRLIRRRQETGRLTFWHEEGKVEVWAVYLGALPVALWTLFKAVHRIENDLDILTTLLHFRQAVALVCERIWTVANFFVAEYGRSQIVSIMLAILLVALLRWLLARKDPAPWLRIQRHEVAAWWAFAAVHIPIFAFFCLTPEDVTWHLETAAGRVLFFPYLILFLILLYHIEALILQGSGGQAQPVHGADPSVAP